MNLTSDQFRVNEAWILFRIDQFLYVQDQPVDVYMLMDASSFFIFDQLLVPDEISKKYKKKFNTLFKNAKKKAKQWPQKLILPEGDPAEQLCRMHSKKNHYSFEIVPYSYLSAILDPLKQSFSTFINKPSSEMNEPEGKEYQNESDDDPTAQYMIQDSYDPCSCGSGKKFKFCCKPVFREITEAMCAAEDGDIDNALDWMKKAEKKVGKTPEILCRYAVVYSFFDQSKYDEYLTETLEIAPNHPRASYLLALEQTASGQLDNAIESYKKAIANYPETDKYHLNESWTNLANLYFGRKDYPRAKAGWEKAIMLMPKDKLSRSNLLDLIINNPAVPEELKTINPIIELYLKG